MKILKIFLAVLLMASFSTPVFADTEFMLGKETKGFSVKIDDDTKLMGLNYELELFYFIPSLN